MLKETYAKTDLDTIIESEIPFHKFLDEGSYDRYLIQFVDMREDINPNSIFSKVECHAAVLAKVQNKWWLLDSAKQKPFLITGNDHEAKLWLAGIDYIHKWVFEIDNPKKV